MPSLITQKKWIVADPPPSLCEGLGRAASIHPILSRVFVNRGVSTPDAMASFLRCDLRDLSDPFLMTDMDRAIDRVRLAGERHETVLIFGDYDVDGVTASVVLNKALTRFGLHVRHHIPDRMDDGYGLGDDAVDIALRMGAQLVIAVDCGITAVGPVRALMGSGIDVIILDHHEPGEGGVPEAVAVVDPKRRDCRYPFKHLAAVGIAAKFTQALFGALPTEILDLVALGTIADVVPLLGENRIFVQHGLSRIQQTDNLGLQALLEVSGIKGKPLRPYHAGFILGPRINAAGRMESAAHSLELLLSRDFKTAMDLAVRLDAMNLERQQLQRVMIQEAIAMVDGVVDLEKDPVIVLAKEGWHKGVLGIVASKIVETFYRPAVVATLSNGEGTGSARSIEGFALHDALHACRDVLDAFGGHRLAAGLSFQEKNLDRFRERVNAYARETLGARDLIPSLMIDAEVGLDELDVGLISTLNALEPYGEGNRAPVFCSRRLTIKSQPVSLAKETLKFWVTDGRTTLSVVGFGMGAFKDRLAVNQTVDLAYELAIDDWNKAPVVQLRLRDIRLS